ncbi:MAG TPA: hypothetical protein VFG51_01245 [Candidatus Saccharimonadia bacterium]|nr:hypothetical protein [Candidatus Saccharimonadia bacterium]
MVGAGPTTCVCAGIIGFASGMVGAGAPTGCSVNAAPNAGFNGVADAGITATGFIGETGMFDGISIDELAGCDGVTGDDGIVEDMAGVEGVVLGVVGAAALAAFCSAVSCVTSRSRFARTSSSDLLATVPVSLAGSVGVGTTLGGMVEGDDGVSGVSLMFFKGKPQLLTRCS